MKKDSFEGEKMKGCYFTQESPMKLNLNKEFLDNLNAWADEYEDDEEVQKESKKKAAKRILECKSAQSKSLDLSGLKLTSLPDQIFDLIQLKELNLEGNQLNSISGKISNLKKLEKLYLKKGKPIEDFSKVIELAEGLNTWADEHDIDEKQKERREEAVGIILLCNLKKSKSLDLAGLKLTSLPDQIFDLIQLENLYLADNELTSLPDQISDLRNLKKLDLEKNPIESLPELDWDKIKIIMDSRLSEEALEKHNKLEGRKLKTKNFAKSCPTTEKIEDFFSNKPSCNFKPIKAEPTKTTLQKIGK